MYLAENKLVLIKNCFYTLNVSIPNSFKFDSFTFNPAVFLIFITNFVLDNTTVRGMNYKLYEYDRERGIE
jgi:hypothetical protein